MRTTQVSVGSILCFSLTVLIGAMICHPIDPVSAQNDDVMGFVDRSLASQEQIVPDQTQNYPEQFNAAEHALSEGLSKRGSEPAHHTFPSPEEIKRELSDKPSASAPLVRHIKSPISPTGQDLRLDMEPIPLNQEDVPTTKTPQIAKNVSFTQPVKIAPEQEARTSKKAQSSAGKETVLQNKLVSSESKVRDLEKQLGEARSQLASAELEIRRLSSVIENDSRARLNLPQLPSASTTQKQAATVTTFASVKSAPPPQPQRVPDATQDLQVATIVADKADLRLGPGKNHSALMTLRKGSRLAIEARQGEWYRVFAPNGQRAWIHASSVRFGEGATNFNDGSSIRMRGFDAALN